MSLLVVTDHTFIRCDGQVLDTYCFDRAFFEDYRRVFGDVVVAARMRDGERPSGAHRSDGDGVRFIGMPNVHGPRWVLRSGALIGPTLRAAVAHAEAVCVRIPGMAGYTAARVAVRSGRPVQFELIGDPYEAGKADRARVGLAGYGFGVFLALRTRWIVRHAVAGSYVSRAHLQARYPACDGVPTESISSIRLPPEQVRPPRVFASAPGPLRLICVASLLPVKDHETLIAAVARLRAAGIACELHLCGEGPQLGLLQEQVRREDLGGVVQFHGHVAGRANLDARLDAADLFVLTSLNEGMPRAMLEAMARGLPVVGTSAGGIRELLEPDQLVPVRDPIRLAELVGGLARDPGALSRLAGRSHAVVRGYTADILSERRVRLLSTLRAAARERRA